MKLPELLAPAGGMRQLLAAVRFGADAVYVGMKNYGLRAYAGNFDDDELKKAVRIAHGAGKRLYVTMNIFAYDEDIPGMIDAAKRAQRLGVDAAIVSDIGVMSLLNEQAPGLALHVSTQANTVNSRTAGLYGRMGARRVILSRELSLEQIRIIRQSVPPELELEAFVHGAVCMSYSGRCVLSNYLTGRDANQGSCAQPCRWRYALAEQTRPGEYMPILEDARGTYILSAHDLCMIEHIPALVESGIASLKIEGRMKTEYYVATVVGAYRRALDAYARCAQAYEQMLPALVEELGKTSHRPSDTGFYFGRPDQCAGAEGFLQTREFTASVIERLPTGELLLEVKNRFFKGDALEAMTPGGIIPLIVGDIVMEDTGERVSVVGHPKARVRIEAPAGIEAGDLLRGVCRNHARLS